ncbi:MAG: CDP-archaeol synthase [Clostridia bacterium]|nr:CDP-archaeol synthase [Clostridia bacterium]
MKQRILTGIVMAVTLIPCHFFTDTVLLVVLMVLFSTVGSFEMLRCLGYHKNVAVSLPVYLCALGLPFLARYTSSLESFFGFAFCILFLLMFYMMSLAVVYKGKQDINRLITAFAANFYVIFGITSIILVRDMPNGLFTYLLIFVGAWMTDIGAYFIGVLFGKHKLIPEVSPKKTVEGAVGGIAVNVLSFCIYGFVIDHFFDATPNYLAMIVTALVVSIISMFGDLVASIIKRQYGIKDYGKLFPGHGGVVDRFDSIISVAPFFVILSTISSFFNLFS